MNRSRRAAAWPLALLLLAASLAGCSGSSSDGRPPSAQSEPMEISVAFWDLAENMLQDDPALRLLEQKLNLTIKPIPIKIENYMQQIQMWASNGQLPDIFSVDAVNTQYYRSWRDRGVIKPIPDDLSAYPHLQAYLSLPGTDGLKDDGRLYFIPRQTYDSTDYNVLDRLVVYRWDLAQEAGIAKEPATWNEFRAMLKAIVDRDPENKHIRGLTANGNLLLGGLFWLYGSPAATSDGSGSDFKWIKEDGRYIPAVFSKHSIASLRLLRDFYASGLIDPDLPVTRGEMARDKFAEGKVAALILAGGAQKLDVSLYREGWLKHHPEDSAFYDKIKLLKPLPSIDGNRYHALFKTFWSESYISAKVDDRKMARILELFDYLNTDEFKEMRRFGLENADYVKEDGRITPLGTGASVVTKYKAFSTFANLLDWDGMYALNPDYAGISQGAKEAQRELVDYSMRTTRKQEYEPKLTQLSTPTKDGFTIFDSDDMIRVMISDLPVEAAWQTIIDGYKEKGLDRMIEEVNARAGELGLE
ncbi:extracellular solute-binding protein [Cohnella cellulosilytica]|uniref:Extracellular solute-binding protein n=1 Tax=Cohnella cellulosilytica TaxID=986710 RepID=A0ABW2F988_9BACL